MLDFLHHGQVQILTLGEGFQLKKRSTDNTLSGENPVNTHAVEQIHRIKIMNKTDIHSISSHHFKTNIYE